VGFGQSGVAQMKIRIQDSGFRNQEQTGSCRFRFFSGSRILNPGSSKGFTLLELIIVIAIISVLAGLFLNRVPYYQEQAEKTAMEQVVGALQSAIVLQYGKHVTRGRDAELRNLATDNPMNWLQQKPRNYAGEFFDPTPASTQPGNWMFDLRTHELIYVVDRGDYFTPSKDGKKWIRFRVNQGYESIKGGAGNGNQELISSLIEPVEAYRWFN
jgi:general secretion pathway protein G